MKDYVKIKNWLYRFCLANNLKIDFEQVKENDCSSFDLYLSIEESNHLVAPRGYDISIVSFRHIEGVLTCVVGVRLGVTLEALGELYSDDD